MAVPPLRVVIADDERPARMALAALLARAGGVTVVAEARNGADAIAAIEREQPDLAFLDLQMPEIDGLGVVRLLREDRMPLVAFVTAYDEFAIKAFEINAVDYLLKPVDAERLRQTLDRARERLARAPSAGAEVRRLAEAARDYEDARPLAALTRIPVRRRDDIVLLPIGQVASVVADGELLHLTTIRGERFTITYRLKDLEARLDPARFVRLERGAIVNLDAIAKVSPMPGATYLVTLVNNQEIRASRQQSKVLREQVFKL
jgi:two-component system LytT family response regulator